MRNAGTMLRRSSALLSAICVGVSFIATSLCHSHPERLVVDGYVRWLVKPSDVKRPKIVSGLVGGLDAGSIGDAFGFVLAHLDKRWKHDNPQAISVFFKAKQSSLKIAIGYKAYAEGNKLLAVYLDEKEISRFCATFAEKGYEGEFRTAETVVPVEQVNWSRETHELKVMAVSSWGAGLIDVITIEGEGVRLVHPKTGKELSETDLQQLIEEATPHLPKGLRLPSEAIGLDFGDEGTPVWSEAGFVRVTSKMEFGKEKMRYGFSKANVALTPVDEPSWDALRRDGILMKAENPTDNIDVTFSIGVPNGDYEVWFVIGGVPFPSGYRACFFSVEGQHEFLNTFATSTDMVLNRPSITHRTLPCRVRDGQLDVRIYGGSFACIRALLIYPKKISAEMRALTERIVEAYYLPRCEDVSEPIPPPLITLSEQDVRRGFTVFPVQPLQSLPRQMTPTEAIRAGNALSKQALERAGANHLHASACPGEYEPVTFALWALEDLKKVKVRVHWEKQAPIAVDVRWVKWLKISTATRPTGEWRWEERALMKMDEFSVLKEGTVTKFWLTMRPSEKAKAGIYRGRVEVIADGKSASLPLTFTVRPFRLHPLRERYHAVWWGPAYYGDAERTMEAQLRNMKQHGITATTLYAEGVPKISLSKDGNLQLDFSRMAKVMELRKRYGLVAPTPLTSTWYYLREPLGKTSVSNNELVRDEQFRKLYPQLVRAIQEEAKRRGWNELWEYVVDEPSTSWLEWVKELLALAKEGGAKTFITIRPDDAKYFDKAGAWKLLDIPCFSGPNDEAFNWLGERDLVFYTGGYGDANYVRAVSGFYFWRVKAKWLGFWVYCWVKGDPWFDLDNDLRETGFVYPDVDEPVPTVQYEMLREGIDDARYLQTLEDALQDAERIKPEKAKAIRLQFDELLKRIPTDHSKLSEWTLPYAGEVEGAKERPARPAFDWRTMQNWREQIAKWIEQLLTKPS